MPHLKDELSPVQWREVKQVALCARLGYSERTIRDALDVLAVLAERGYLERDDDETPAHAGSSRRFRLVYSRDTRV